MSLNEKGERKIYNTFTVLAYLMDRISPDSQWKMRVRDCIDRHEIDATQMGFPDGFEGNLIWVSV